MKRPVTEKSDESSVSAARTASGQLARTYDAVEFLGTDDTEMQGGLFESQIVVESVMRHLGGPVVADDRTERGYQHERALHEELQLRAIRFRTLHQEGRETGAAITQETQ